MYITGSEKFSAIEQIIPAQAGWRAAFAVSDYSDFVILPLIAWMYGKSNRFEEESGESRTHDMMGGLVYAFPIGGELRLAPISEFFMCYLSPDDDISDDDVGAMLKRRLSSCKEVWADLNKKQAEEGEIETDARSQRLRHARKLPIEIDFD